MILEMMHDMGDMANSPFIVPVAGCVMIAAIVIAGNWSSARKRELESQERLAAIARGVPIPPSLEELAIIHGRPLPEKKGKRGNTRTAGIVLLGTAAGMILFFVALATILRERDVLCGAAVGLIPLGIGIGLLIDAGIQKREQERAVAEAASGGPVR